MNSPVFTLVRGSAPLLVSIPHAGTEIPPEQLERMTPEARFLDDTDWHVPELYAFARDLGASILTARYSRYVVDLNRPRDDQSLYPGQSTTGLCPIDTFAEVPLYPRGQEPSAEEIVRRVETYWVPYHHALQGELERLRSHHQNVCLWDAHSIASVVPRFFEGRLPDFNIGTNSGASCAPGLGEEILALAQTVPGATSVLNGRFKGGAITRTYGAPDRGIHAVQLELAQSAYLVEGRPYAWNPDRAPATQRALARLVTSALRFVTGK